MKELIKDIINKTLENGGTTTSILTKCMNPSAGFMCSIKDCDIVDINSFDSSCIEKIISENIYLLSKDGVFLGTWVDEGKVYIDISENITDIENAKTVGIARKQLAIFDCFKKEVIYL